MAAYAVGAGSISDDLTNSRSEFVLEPFTLHSPAHGLAASTSEKLHPLSRTVPPHGSHGGSADNVRTDPTMNHDANGPDTQVERSNGDLVALRAMEQRLERRLMDNLMQTLAVHGETESNPPAYDGREGGPRNESPR